MAECATSASRMLATGQTGGTEAQSGSMPWQFHGTSPARGSAGQGSWCMGRNHGEDMPRCVARHG